MRIEKIEIKNYRQYPCLEYTFQQTKPTDLHVAIARNGIGKTNFLNAITWCLYGNEPHLNQKSDALPIMNIKRLEELNEGDNEVVQVELTVSISQGEYKIRRTENFRKTASQDKPLFSMRKIITVEETSITNSYKEYMDDDAKTIINQLFPEKISEYFFFDNERLDRYFRDNTSDKIKGSVYDISQISLLMQAKDKLRREHTSLQRSLSRNNPELEKSLNKLEIAELDFNECKNRIENSRLSIEKGENRLNELTRALEGVENIADIKEKLIQLERQAEKAKQIRDELKINLNEFVRRYLLLLNMYPSLVKAKRVIDFQESEGNLPPKIDTAYIQKLIDDKKCFIEGCSLDDCKIEKLKQIIDTVSYSSETSHLLVEVKSDINRLIEEAKQYEVKKSELFKQIDENDCKCLTLQNEIEDVRRVIAASSNEEKITQLFEEKDVLTRMLNQERSKKAQDESKVSFFAKKVDTAKVEYENELSKVNRQKELKAKVELSSQALDLMETIESGIIDEIKTELKDEVFTTFKSLLWKENTFKEIMINDDFSIDLIHNKGYSCLGSCSAAETSLLALAFTLGLHKVSGFDAPIVIDTPVGRVSDEHREKFASVLKKVSENKEIIMFFTPSEYSSEVEGVFHNSYSTLKYLETRGEEETRVGK